MAHKPLMLFSTYRLPSTAAFFATLLTAGHLAVAEGLEKAPEFRAAEAALKDGLPAVCGLKATRLLTETGFSEEERTRLAALAVEGWVRAGEGRRAMAVLQQHLIPDQTFWQAQALLLNGEGGKATQLLIEQRDAQKLTSRGRLLLARLLLSQDQDVVVRELLESLQADPDADIRKQARLILDEADLIAGRQNSALARLNEESARHEPMVRYLRARAELEGGRSEEGRRLLQDILADASGGEQVHHAATLLLAKSILEEQQPAACREKLVQFLDTTSESALWTEAFDLLGEALDKLPNEPLSPILLRWISDGNAEHRQALVPPQSLSTFKGYAMFLAARWLKSVGRTEEALGLLEALLQLMPGHPQESAAMRLAMETYGEENADARVLALADLWRQRFGQSGSSMVDFVTGSVLFDQGDYQQSLQLFRSAANIASSLNERRNALYNACIAAIRAGETALYQALLGQLAVVGPNDTTQPTPGDSAADVELNKALQLASTLNAEAEKELQEFLQKHANHPRTTEARLALAEFYLQKQPASPQEARRQLQLAADSNPIDPALRQRIDYIRLWALESSGDLHALSEQGTAFLKAWPTSAWAAEIRMKVADAFYRQGSFGNARTQFELVANAIPATPYTETALYFAGMAAMEIGTTEARNAAIGYWQELAVRKSPLSTAARQQQYLMLWRDGKEAEALALVNELLLDKTANEDQRRALTCEKAELLMVLAKKDATQLQAAIDALSSLYAENRLAYFWRARAGFALAKAYHESGRTTEALEVCYDVVQNQAYRGPSNAAEYRWYYKAGFFGIELLEESRQWEAAAVLAEKLARSQGDRATEAKERATKIRLDHFLWDGSRN